MTLDDLTPEEWPAGAREALERWRQGNLIVAQLGTWIGPAGVLDPITGFRTQEDPSGVAAVAVDLSDTGHLAVISQTCDIALSGPGLRHPLVQVCPVRNVGVAFNGEKLEQIKRGEIVDYAYLTKPPVKGSQWAIDLRVSFPMSKALLLDNAPIVAFKREADEVRLAQRIAIKYRRPAMHDAVAAHIVNALTTTISRAKGTAPWCDDIEQMRLEVMTGTRLHPERVRLVVITDKEITPADKTTLRQMWLSQRKPLRAHGIAIAPISFRTLRDWDIIAYRESIPLNIPALSRGSFE